MAAIISNYNFDHVNCCWDDFIAYFTEKILRPEDTSIEDQFKVMATLIRDYGVVNVIDALLLKEGYRSELDDLLLLMETQ
jgi:hypothetical protein